MFFFLNVAEGQVEVLTPHHCATQSLSHVPCWKTLNRHIAPGTRPFAYNSDWLTVSQRREPQKGACRLLTSVSREQVAPMPQQRHLTARLKPATEVRSIERMYCYFHRLPTSTGLGVYSSIIVIMYQGDYDALQIQTRV